MPRVEIPLPCQNRPISCFSCPFQDCVLSEAVRNNRLEAKFRTCGTDSGRKGKYYYKTGSTAYHVKGGTW